MEVPEGIFGKPMGIETFQNLSYYAKDAFGLQGQISPPMPSPWAPFNALTGGIFLEKTPVMSRRSRKYLLGLTGSWVFDR
jgi:hypothetical protein